VKTRFLTVKKGQVAGIHHVCKGYVEQKERIRLDLQMFVGAKKPGDQIAIKGKPDVNLSIDGGVAGDEATVAMLLNMIPAVREAQPGLRTMTDISVPRFRF
jgi:4-hydroxy-tetrahydrodipicolinate reductase